MAVEKNRPDNDPTDLDEDDCFVGVEGQLCQPDWVTLKASVDRDVVDWFRARWHDYRSSMNQVLKAYMDKKMKVVIPIQDYGSERVRVVGKYDPAVVSWLRNKPNSDGFMSLVLRDFMQGCIEHERSTT